MAEKEALKNIEDVGNKPEETPPKINHTIGCLDIFFLRATAVCRMLSLIFTVYTAVDLIATGRPGFGIGMLFFLGVSLSVTILIKLKMHQEDLKENRVLLKAPYTKILNVIVRPVFFRHWKALNLYNRYSKSSEKFYKTSCAIKYWREVSDIALLSIFETFLGGAPQKLMQLSGYLVSNLRWNQFFLMVLYLFLIAISITSYYKNIRKDQPLKQQVDLEGTFWLILWHFCITISRIFALSLIASLYWEYTLALAIIHSLVMTLWIYFWDRSLFCKDSSIGSFFFSMALGFVYVFTYILPKEDHTRYRYTVYYSICFLENLVAILLFVGLSHDNKHSEVEKVLCWGSVLLFAAGIAFMVTYYVLKRQKNVLKRPQGLGQPSVSVEAVAPVL